MNDQHTDYAAVAGSCKMAAGILREAGQECRRHRMGGPASLLLAHAYDLRALGEHLLCSVPASGRMSAEAALICESALFQWADAIDAGIQALQIDGEPEAREAATVLKLASLGRESAESSTQAELRLGLGTYAASLHKSRTTTY